MQEVWLYTVGSVLLVSVISLIGILTLSLKDSVLNKILLLLVSFATGGLLGGAFFHLIPATSAAVGFGPKEAIYSLLGIVVFFVMEKFIHWRHCHTPTSENHPHPVATMNLVGDAMHNFTDGIIIAGTYLIDIKLGISTTIAVILHEIPQEIGDFGVLIHSGYSKKKALFLNFLITLTSILGATLVLSVGPQVADIEHVIAPFTAGGFIYIASSDLIPELHKETKILKSLGQLVSLIFGITIMGLLLFLE